MKVTDQQRDVVTAAGDFLLLACPGSGKTRSAAARVRAQIAKGRKVAICSYTNVGADHFRQILGEMRAVLGPEHVVSTLHAFLLRYVVYPFGTLTGARRGPYIVEHAGGSVAFAGNNRRRIPVSDFRMRPDGSLKLTKHPVYLSTIDEDEVIATVEGDVRRAKRRLLREGYVSFDDAIYVALCILRQHPRIARAVASRFDELLLDEAQDTSELQLACIDELKAARLRSLVMIGDLEQSIFAFQGASAEGCRALATKHKLQIVKLTENHRCSQRICDVAVHFCERSDADRAVGPTAQCTIDPEVIFYPPYEPAVVVQRFRRRLEAHGADPADAAVLARNNTLVHELNQDEAPVSIGDRPLTLGRATAALRSGTVTRRQLEGVQRIVASAAWGEESLDILDLAARERLRAQTVWLLGALPSLDEDLRAWIRAAAGLLSNAAGRLKTPPTKAGGTLLRSKAEQAGIIARNAFVAPPRELEAQTVHDIKGEDRDAVLVVVDRPRSYGHDPQTQLWRSALAGEEIDTEYAEEKRVAFVALTRAKRICVVALPDDNDGRDAAEAFVAKGFRIVEMT